MHLHDCRFHRICHHLLTCRHAHLFRSTEKYGGSGDSIDGCRGALPRAPAELGGASLTELLRDGTVKTTIDPKYPQAIGIESILRNTARFGNFKWEVFHNDSDDSPFFTSDFPVAIEKTAHSTILNRIVPLAPDLALRIRPDVTLDTDRADFSFANFGYLSRRPSRNELRELNRSIVRCAEDLVFYRDDHAWVRPFVSKNRWYRVEPRTDSLPSDAGTFLISTQSVVARSPSPLSDKEETR